MISLHICLLVVAGDNTHTTKHRINPVKIILHVFPHYLSPWHIAATSGLLMLYIFISDLKAILYFMVKTFFHSILSIFFRSVEVTGRHNIPAHGPVIFAS
jgi:glycerol-3-phosphate O-acyltransferase / dihydroxyacetone phosphate acyltransferase